MRRFSLGTLLLIAIIAGMIGYIVSLQPRLVELKDMRNAAGLIDYEVNAVELHPVKSPMDVLSWRVHIPKHMSARVLIEIERYPNLPFGPDFVLTHGELLNVLLLEEIVLNPAKTSVKIQCQRGEFLTTVDTIGILSREGPITGITDSVKLVSHSFIDIATSKKSSISIIVRVSGH